MNQVPFFDRERKQNMIELKIGGRQIPLFYSVCETLAIQKEIGCTAFQLKDEVFGLELEDEEDPTSYRLNVANDAEKTEKLVKLIRILGNAGLEEKEEEPDLTDKWIMRHMKPALVPAYAVAVLAEIVEGNKVEGPKADEEGPVEEILEAEKEKKQPEN